MIEEINRVREKIVIRGDLARDISKVAVYVLSILIALTILFVVTCTEQQAGHLKAYFDVLYDTSGFFIVVIATFALLTAILQSREAAKTRKASVIIDIESRWSSKGLEESRIKYQRLLNVLYKTERIPDEPEEQKIFRDFYKDNIPLDYVRVFLDFTLTNMRNSEDERNVADYHDILEMAAFFEYIGYLVGKDYLHAEDIYSLFGVSCINYYDRMSSHIESIRKLDPERAGSNGGSRHSAFQNFSVLVEKLRSVAGPI